MFETETVKSDCRKDQIEQYTKIGSPVQIRADSESMNSDPIQNNRTILIRQKQMQKLSQKILLKNQNTCLSMYSGNRALHAHKNKLLVTTIIKCINHYCKLAY